MDARRPDPRAIAEQRRGLTSIDGANALIAVLVIVQIWLLKTALDAHLAGHGIALPALIASGVLCASCVLLYRLVRRIERDLRRGAKDPRADPLSPPP